MNYKKFQFDVTVFQASIHGAQNNNLTWFKVYWEMGIGYMPIEFCHLMTFWSMIDYTYHSGYKILNCLVSLKLS
jgi:hypothetical protein